MKTAITTYIVILILALLSIEGESQMPTNQTYDTDISDVDFEVKDIGTFDLADQKYRIWASLKNDTTKSARQWQFLLEPLLQPVRKEGIVETVVNGRVVVFQLALWSNESIDKALEVLRNEFPENAEDILRSNIRPIPIKYIHMETSEFQEVDPQAKIENSDVPIRGFPESVEFKILASSPDTAKQIAVALPDWIFTYKISYSARIALQARASIQGTDQLKNDFKANLDGVPPTSDGNRYVYRNDFRKFLQSHESDILANVSIEQGSVADPSEFFETVTKSFLVRWDGLESKDFDQLDANSKQSTFNNNDLTPDKLSNEINKTFVKASGENQFKMNASEGAEAGFSGFTGKQNGSFSEDEIESYLRQNDVDAEWTGEKWVVKNLKVRQINDTAIDSLFRGMTVFTQILPPETKTESSQIAFDTVSSDSVNSIGGRLSDLERIVSQFNTLPIGTILPYCGKLSDLDGTGWVVCNSENATKYPGIVPNLENRFIQGVGGDTLGKIGGIVKLPDDGGFSTTVHTHASKGGRAGGNINFQGEGKQCYETEVDVPINIPPHHHGGDIRPLYYTAYYIVRIH